MRIAKVCKGGCGNKPAMWFDGGIHAREWISPATVMYMLMELVEHDADHPDLTENLDWYILPVVNPDGYLYTQTDNRLWRKTRVPNGNTGCFGTDANRNWGFHWGTGGSSDDPCSDIYMGSEPFSEVENRNMRDFLIANKDQIKFYNNVHSYSQLVLVPWGWGYEEPDNVDDLYAMANKGNDALYAVHHKTFEVGCIPCLLYVASGGTLDWTLGELGIPYSYAMELRDTGSYGFILPPDQIIPSGEEVWAFHMTVAREIITEFVPSV
jgi:murein tripeptide amidase MpaA